MAMPRDDLQRLPVDHPSGNREMFGRARRAPNIPVEQTGDSGCVGERLALHVARHLPGTFGSCKLRVWDNQAVTR
jgi:hypothetical protein